MNRHTARPACWSDGTKVRLGPPAKQLNGPDKPWPGDATWCGNATADYWMRHLDMTPGCLCCGAGYEARVLAGEG